MTRRWAGGVEGGGVLALLGSPPGVKTAASEEFEGVEVEDGSSEGDVGEGDERESVGVGVDVGVEFGSADVVEVMDVSVEAEVGSTGEVVRGASVPVVGGAEETESDVCAA